MTVGNMVSAGYECNASLVFPHRYNSVSGEVVFYQFLCKMIEPAALLTVAKVTGYSLEISAEYKHNKKELHKMRVRETNCVKTE